MPFSRFRWHSLALMFASLATAAGCGASEHSRGGTDASAGTDSTPDGSAGIGAGGAGAAVGGVAGSSGGRAVNGGSAGDGGSASAGGASSSSAGMSSSGSAGVSSSGSAGAQTQPIKCPQGAFPDPSTKSLAPDVRQTFAGTNGTFSDSCDSNGDLTAYRCKVDQISAGDGSAIPTATGEVEQKTIACGGACVDGTCAGVCEKYGDKMQVVSADASGDTILEDERTHWRYRCQTYGVDPCVTTPLAAGTEFDLMEATDGCWEFDYSVLQLTNGPDGAKCSYTYCRPVGR
jgi:hypothetical protein